VKAELLEVIAQFTEVPADHAQPLELASLELVQLAETLEEHFAFVVDARDLNEKNFGSVARIEAYVARKRAAG